MIITGGLPGGQMSGSAGAVTASHNRYGMYFRMRTVPVNPNTARQSTIRAILANLSQYWANTLTAAERAQWDAYAAAIAWKNKVGQTVYLTGFNHFVRSNTARVQAGLAIVEAGPATLTLPDTDPTLAVSMSASTQLISVTFDDTMDWCDLDGAAMLVSAGQPQGTGRTFFNGPYRFADSIDGDSGSPPTSPQTVTSPFVVQENQLVWVEARIVLDDGRLSERFLATCVCAA